MRSGFTELSLATTTTDAASALLASPSVNPDLQSLFRRLMCLDSAHDLGGTPDGSALA